jgi:Zn-dependent alcohol dehydrogenase
MFVVSSQGGTVRVEKDATLVSISSDGCTVVSNLPAVSDAAQISNSPERFAVQVGSVGDPGATPNLSAMGGQITGLNFRFSAGTQLAISILLGTICQLFFEEVPAEP